MVYNLLFKDLQAFSCVTSFEELQCKAVCMFRVRNSNSTGSDFHKGFYAMYGNTKTQKLVLFQYEQRPTLSLCVMDSNKSD